MAGTTNGVKMLRKTVTPTTKTTIRWRGRDMRSVPDQKILSFSDDMQTRNNKTRKITESTSQASFVKQHEWAAVISVIIENTTKFLKTLLFCLRLSAH